MSERENGWISHCIGLEKLFSLRGPESFSALPELLIFENSRQPIILAALVLRQHTVLSKAAWKSIPWSLYPDRKTPTQRLVDILADCPGLFVERSSLASTPQSSHRESAQDDLLRRIRSLLDQLDQWKQQGGLSHVESCHEVVPESATPILINDRGVQVPAWTTALEYESLDAANQVTLYYAISILILRLAQETASVAVTTPTQVLDAVDFPERIMSASLAICRSVQFHLEMIRCGAGSFFLLFPLRMAYDAIGRSHPAIGTWLEDVLQQIQGGQAGRWATAKYLLDIEPASAGLYKAAGMN